MVGRSQGRNNGGYPVARTAPGLVGLLCCISARLRSRPISSDSKLRQSSADLPRWQRAGLTYRIATGRPISPRLALPQSHFRWARAASPDPGAIEADSLRRSPWESPKSFRRGAPDTRADILIGARRSEDGSRVFLRPCLAEPAPTRAHSLPHPPAVKIGFDASPRYAFLHLRAESSTPIGLYHPPRCAIMGYRYATLPRLAVRRYPRAVALYGTRQPDAVHTEVLNNGAPISTLRRFAKRWGTRGLAPRSP